MRSTYLTFVLAILRALQLHYQTAHWQARGPQFYGDHLLFERLYGNLGAEIDALAEKIAGIDGDTHLGLEAQMGLITNILAMCHGSSDAVANSIYAEETLQEALTQVYDGIEAEGTMTLGLDDFIMALASAHEEHLYLLKQRHQL